MCAGVSIVPALMHARGALLTTSCHQLLCPDLPAGPLPVPPTVLLCHAWAETRGRCLRSRWPTAQGSNGEARSSTPVGEGAVSVEGLHGGVFELLQWRTSAPQAVLSLWKSTLQLQAAVAGSARLGQGRAMPFCPPGFLACAACS